MDSSGLGPSREWPDCGGGALARQSRHHRERRRGRDSQEPLRPRRRRAAASAAYGNCIGVPNHRRRDVKFQPQLHRQSPSSTLFALGDWSARDQHLLRGTASRRRQSRSSTSARRPAATACPARPWPASRIRAKPPRPSGRTVQVGDPVHGEAAPRSLSRSCIADGRQWSGIQDMGAAGLTCSTCETAVSAGTGIEIELDPSVPATRARHDALRDHAERVAGAHAAGRPERP